mgnify:CR=1 FL=1
MLRWQRHCEERGCNRRLGQFLEPALLLLLEQAPAHGYTLLDRMPEFGLEFLAPTVIYRALREMEARGWVSSTWEEKATQGPPRRIYALTSVGREVLSCCLLQMRGMQQVVEYVLALHDELDTGRGPVPDPSIENPEEVVMKVVVPANGADLDAPVSPVFGRCAVFVLVDPDTMEFEALPNPAVDAPGGAGVQSAQAVLQRGASAVIAPSLGPNAFRVIQSAGVPAYRLEGATVREVVEAFRDGRLSEIGTPGPDHVGLGGGRGRGWGR